MLGAIIGFGTIAMGHLNAYRRVDDLEVVAVVDPAPDRRAVAEKDYGLYAYASLEEMLDAMGPSFIDICSPPSTHIDYIRIGAEAGIHVLCEKPVLLPSSVGYAEVIELITSARSVVYPCHNYKFAPILRFMDDIVRSADFGDVMGAHFRTLRKGHAVGVDEWDPHWRRKPAIAAGGILRDHGPHSIYLATHLTGKQPLAVSCLTGNLSRDGYADTEDTALLTVRCSDDVQFSLDLSWSASYRNTYYQIIGTSSSVTVENDDVCYCVDGKAVRTVLASDFDDPSHANWFGAMFKDFLNVIDDPWRQQALITETLMTSIVIDTAYESARCGGRWMDLTIPAVPLPRQNR